MKTILVTGGDGQLGLTLFEQSVLLGKPEDNYVFLGHKDLDITSKKSIEEAFKKYKPDIVINCAAFTNVESAETKKKEAYNINSTAVENLKKACKKHNAFLFHFSTDYVYDGTKNTPYTEEDDVNPLNIYGSSKLLGDMMLLGNENVIIFRVSWLYSNYGNNFFKKVMEFVKEGKQMSVVIDQIGTPTYARDLANTIIFIINDEKYIGKSGIYNFSEEGTCSWYDFAKAIELLAREHQYGPLNNSIFNPFIIPCKTASRKDKAKRPSYSVLDKSKFYEDFHFLKRPHWLEALNICMNIELSKMVLN